VEACARGSLQVDEAIADEDVFDGHDAGEIA
jgi:hypothetical protein